MWKCKHCSEEMSDAFYRCWSCDYSRDGLPPKSGEEELAEQLSPNKRLPESAAQLEIAQTGKSDYPSMVKPESDLESLGLRIKTEAIPLHRSWRVVINQDGESVNSDMQKMFKFSGPLVIGSHRLDRLTAAEIVRDAATVTTHSKSNGKISTKTGSLITRAIVGDLVAGPLGGVIGGGSAKKATTSETITSQENHINIYLSLKFRDEPSPINIQVFDDSAFQQIQACVGQKEWTPAELEYAKAESDLWAAEVKRRNVESRQERVGTEARIAKASIVSLAVGAVAFAVQISAGDSFLKSVAGFALFFTMAFVIAFYAKVEAVPAVPKQRTPSENKAIAIGSSGTGITRVHIWAHRRAFGVLGCSIILLVAYFYFKERALEKIQDLAARGEVTESYAKLREMRSMLSDEEFVKLATTVNKLASSTCQAKGTAEGVRLFAAKDVKALASFKAQCEKYLPDLAASISSYQWNVLQTQLVPGAVFDRSELISRLNNQFSGTKNLSRDSIDVDWDSQSYRVVLVAPPDGAETKCQIQSVSMLSNQAADSFPANVSSSSGSAASSSCDSELYSTADSLLSKRGKADQIQRVGSDGNGLVVEWRYSDCVFVMKRHADSYRVMEARLQ